MRRFVLAIWILALTIGCQEQDTLYLQELPVALDVRSCSGAFRDFSARQWELIDAEYDTDLDATVAVLKGNDGPMLWFCESNTVFKLWDRLDPEHLSISRNGNALSVVGHGRAELRRYTDLSELNSWGTRITTNATNYSDAVTFGDDVAYAFSEFGNVSVFNFANESHGNILGLADPHWAKYSEFDDRLYLSSLQSSSNIESYRVKNNYDLGDKTIESDLDGRAFWFFQQQEKLIDDLGTVYEMQDNSNLNKIGSLVQPSGFDYALEASHINHNQNLGLISAIFEVRGTSSTLPEVYLYDHESLQIIDTIIIPYLDFGSNDCVETYPKFAFFSNDGNRLTVLVEGVDELEWVSGVMIFERKELKYEIVPSSPSF